MLPVAIPQSQHYMAEMLSAADLLWVLLTHNLFMPLLAPYHAIVCAGI